MSKICIYTMTGFIVVRARILRKLKFWVIHDQHRKLMYFLLPLKGFAVTFPPLLSLGYLSLSNLCCFSNAFCTPLAQQDDASRVLVLTLPPHEKIIGCSSAFQRPAVSTAYIYTFMHKLFSLMRSGICLTNQYVSCVIVEADENPQATKTIALRDHVFLVLCVLCCCYATTFWPVSESVSKALDEVVAFSFCLAGEITAILS